MSTKVNLRSLLSGYIGAGSIRFFAINWRSQMPTILVIGPYRFFFYSSDGSEPRHIHVEREDKVAKFWLNPVMLQSSGGFSPLEINRIHRLVAIHQKELSHAWDKYFGS
jgi:hypothetical protein